MVCLRLPKQLLNLLRKLKVISVNNKNMSKEKKTNKDDKIIRKDYKSNPPELKKGQKCWLCKKEIKGTFCYDGCHYWHEKCKNKDTMKRIMKYLEKNK